MVKGGSSVAPGQMRKLRGWKAERMRPAFRYARQAMRLMVDPVARALLAGATFACAEAWVDAAEAAGAAGAAGCCCADQAAIAALEPAPLVRIPMRRLLWLWCKAPGRKTTMAQAF